MVASERPFGDFSPLDMAIFAMLIPLMGAKMLSRMVSSRKSPAYRPMSFWSSASLSMFLLYSATFRVLISCRLLPFYRIESILLFDVTISLIHGEKESDDDTEAEECDGDNLVPVFFFILKSCCHRENSNVSKVIYTNVNYFTFSTLNSTENVRFCSYPETESTGASWKSDPVPVR